MPFYEYHCEACGHDFQVFVKTMNAPAPLCAKCDGPDVKRRLSTFGVSHSHAPAASPGCAGCDQGGSCPMVRG